MFRKLTSTELESIMGSINRERHFLYYSYLTSRKQNTVHYGQYTEQGDLLGVLASFSGLSFYAFSVFPIQDSFDFRSTLAFVKEQLNIPDHVVGDFILHEEDMAVLTSQIEFHSRPKTLLLMKHIHQEVLPPEDHQILRLGAPYFDLIESKIAELNTMAFTREELRHPFYGVIEHEKLIAVGGYHAYSKDYVELGNIGTDAAWRRQGYGKKICAQLTRTGREVTPNIYLNVLEENAGAIQLYQSIGYEVISKQYMVKFIIGS